MAAKPPPAAATTIRRRRVLFADDQHQVARTLSGLLLPKIDFECRFAPDAEAALERIQTEVFDLVVVDLRMPPGDWGGLWLLRELASRELSVTTLVLSGEAGQSETIEALPLGAIDFVVKDRAAEELLVQVKRALNEAETGRSAFAASRLPTPLALPYQRIAAQRDDDGRLRAALHTVEAVIRFAALAAVATVRHRRELQPAHLAQLSLPTLGKWVESCRQLSPMVQVDPVGRWLAAVCTKETDVLVRQRNDAVHGGALSAVAVKQTLADVTSWLDFFILAAESGTAVELVTAGAMTFTGSTYQVDLATLSGAARSQPWVTVTTARPLVAGRLFLRSGPDFVDLWPLVTASAGETNGDWNVSVMDGYKSSPGRGMAPTDRLKYADVTTSQRQVSPDLTLDDLDLWH